MVSTDGVSGMTTVRLSITLDASQSNVYAMAGTSTTTMSFPAAYQVATPFGADIGGVSPAFFAVANNDALGYAEFDSWLTIGVTDGSAGGAIAASPGFDIASLWTASTGLEETNSAVFFMDPGTMGANSGSEPIVMAQMTLSADNAASGTATAFRNYAISMVAGPQCDAMQLPPKCKRKHQRRASCSATESIQESALRRGGCGRHCADGCRSSHGRPR